MGSSGQICQSYRGICFSTHFVCICDNHLGQRLDSKSCSGSCGCYPNGFSSVIVWKLSRNQNKNNEKRTRNPFGLLNRKRIQLSDIVTCELTKASFGKYWGVGIRYGTDRSLAYSTSLGDAVKIVLKKGRPFVFSSHNPQDICDIIKQTKVSTQGG